MAVVSVSNNRKSHTNKLVYGVGLNDVDYAVQPRNISPRKQCPYYARWCHMLARCYSDKELIRYPNYIGCSVAPEWHVFSAFRSWMQTQKWQDMQLDKDLLSENKTYSPNTCLFVPSWLNSLFRSRLVGGPVYPGVSKHNGRFRGRCAIRNSPAVEAYFDTAHEAHIYYCEEKTKAVRGLYTEISRIDIRLVAACERKLAALVIR